MKNSLLTIKNLNAWYIPEKKVLSNFSLELEIGRASCMEKF